MKEVHQTLLKLQDLDRSIEEAEGRLHSFDPELERLDQPVAELEKEVGSVRTRLEGIRADIRRLERAAEDKRARQEKYEERLQRVRNAREEAAARAEIDLVRKAAEADEQEAMDLMDTRTRTELKLDELEEKLAGMKAELEPHRQDLLGKRREAEEGLQILLDRRTNQMVRMSERSKRLYEQVRGGRTKTVLTAITADGACGHCFSLLPLQKQTEIRRANDLIRCEACGVILYAEE